MFFPVFLSVVLVVRDQADELATILENATESISKIVSDYELIIIDNASEDESIAVLKNLTSEDGIANLQVYALTKEVDSDTASWVGLENALGDFIAVLDPKVDDITVLPQLLDKAVSGADVVFASNLQQTKQTRAYRTCFQAFNTLYRLFGGISLAKEAPRYRLLNKKIANFILQHPSPELIYRHLPATGGFSREYLTYTSPTSSAQKKNLFQSIDRGLQLLVSTTRTPMRLVTSLSLFGAISNLIYSFYVIAIALVKSDVAPGWVTTSLQLSGMFFLISLVLMVLGEYVIQMAKLSNEGPSYHVAQEFISARMTRREKLNIEVVHSK